MARTGVLSEVHEVVQHGGDDARRPVRGRRHDTASARVLLVDGEGVQVDPLHRGERDGDEVGAGIAGQLPEQRGRPARHHQAARQDALVVDAALDAGGHHVPDPQQAAFRLVRRTPGKFVARDHLGDAHPPGAADAQQFDGRGEGELDVGGAIGAGFARRGVPFVDDEAAADRVVAVGVQEAAGAVKGRKRQGVRMAWLCVAVQQQVPRPVEGDVASPAEAQGAFAVDGVDTRHVVVGVDLVGPVSQQAPDDGAVRSVPDARRGERPVQVDTYARDAVEDTHRIQLAHEEGAGEHRPHGVGRRGADADLEQVEGADGHGPPSSQWCLCRRIPVRSYAALAGCSIHVRMRMGWRSIRMRSPLRVM